MRVARALVTGLAGLAVVGCGGRPSYWDTSASSGFASYGLANAVALIDNSDHRVVMLNALADQRLSTRSFPIGHNVLSVSTSRDGHHLFVLSAGDSPRRTASDEFPLLTVIDTSPADPTVTRYAMSVPLPNLALDPLGRWAVAYTGAGAPASFVENTNEIVVFDFEHTGRGAAAAYAPQSRRHSAAFDLHAPAAAPQGPSAAAGRRDGHRRDPGPARQCFLRRDDSAHERDQRAPSHAGGSRGRRARSDEPGRRADRAASQ